MKISAVIPAHNAGRFLDETLRHVFAQTRLPDEVIVINDGSTDDTEAVCQRWQPRIVYRAQANGGVSAARNAISRSSPCSSCDRVSRLSAILCCSRAQSCGFDLRVWKRNEVLNASAEPMASPSTP